MFRSNGYLSGFECGVLLAKSPRNFKKIQPYYNMMCDGGRFFRLAINGNAEIPIVDCTSCGIIPPAIVCGKGGCRIVVDGVNYINTMILYSK